MTNEELEERRQLWLNHRHPQRQLYGDNGEMQYFMCMVKKFPWDFRRCRSKNLESILQEKKNEA